MAPGSGAKRKASLDLAASSAAATPIQPASLSEGHALHRQTRSAAKDRHQPHRSGSTASAAAASPAASVAAEASVPVSGHIVTTGNPMGIGMRRETQPAVPTGQILISVSPAIDQAGMQPQPGTLLIPDQRGLLLPAGPPPVQPVSPAPGAQPQQCGAAHKEANEAHCLMSTAPVDITQHPCQSTASVADPQVADAAQALQSLLSDQRQRSPTPDPQNPQLLQCESPWPATAVRASQGPGTPQSTHLAVQAQVGAQLEPPPATPPAQANGQQQLVSQLQAGDRLNPKLTVEISRSRLPSPGPQRARSQSPAAPAAQMGTQPDPQHAASLPRGVQAAGATLRNQSQSQSQNAEPAPLPAPAPAPALASSSRRRQTQSKPSRQSALAGISAAVNAAEPDRTYSERAAAQDLADFARAPLQPATAAAQPATAAASSAMSAALNNAQPAAGAAPDTAQLTLSRPAHQVSAPSPISSRSDATPKASASGRRLAQAKNASTGPRSKGLRSSQPAHTAGQQPLTAQAAKSPAQSTLQGYLGTASPGSIRQLEQSLRTSPSAAAEAAATRAPPISPLPSALPSSDHISSAVARQLSLPGKLPEVAAQAAEPRHEAAAASLSHQAKAEAAQAAPQERPGQHHPAAALPDSAFQLDSRVTDTSVEDSLRQFAAMKEQIAAYASHSADPAVRQKFNDVLAGKYDAPAGALSAVAGSGEDDSDSDSSLGLTSESEPDEDAAPDGPSIGDQTSNAALSKPRDITASVAVVPPQASDAHQHRQAQKAHVHIPGSQRLYPAQASGMPNQAMRSVGQLHGPNLGTALSKHTVLPHGGKRLASGPDLHTNSLISGAQ